MKMAPPNKNKNKGRTPKMTTQTLLDFDLEESSSDSDFRIEDHDESDDDFSENSNAEDSDQDDDDEDSDDSDSDDESSSDASEKKSKGQKGNYIKDIQDILKLAKTGLKEKVPTNAICCACLGDRSDDANEIVECDGCGVSVHEGCYGVSDSGSVSSTVSSCSTEPWFCEACKAGIVNPSCELCPNRGGIFKETDVGKWVHLVCALYVPGVAFGEVDHLSSVTLFEMSYNKWGSKTCSLCEDARFARTGVCIGCDAGMCKTFFHVTCAQEAGFLSEAHSEEVDHADPFYAHCKIHSDKTMIKHRKRNFNALKLRMEQRKLTKIEHKSEKSTSEQLRIQRKLNKHQTKYRLHKSLKTEPWVPTQKIPRLLTTSATACRRLISKADLMGIDTAALEFQEAQMAALADVRKKWHIPPAFSVEFIGYYLDRISRLKDLKSNLERHIEMNKKLIDEQQTLRDDYDQKIKINSDISVENTKLKDNITSLHKQLQVLCPNKTLPTLENIGRPSIINTQPSSVPPTRPMSVPTAAALKMGVGFPLVNLPGTKDDTGRILSTQRPKDDDLVHECGICKRCNDQHLLAKCDTCHFYYHLGCLNPPLTRHPKKSKLYGWQCSECDKSDDSDVVVSLPKGPRKSRTRFSKDGTIVPVDITSNNINNDENSVKSDTTPTKRKSDDKTTPKKVDEQNDQNDLVPNDDIEKNESILTVKNSQKTNKKVKRTNSPNKPSLIDNGTNDKVNDTNSSVVLNETKKKESSESSAKTNEIKEKTASIEEIDKIHMKSNKKPKKERKSISSEETTMDPIEAKTNNKTQNSTEKFIEKNPQKLIGQLPSIENRQRSEMLIENSTKADITDHIHKQNRKRRKEKHRRHNSSDNEKSISKEHKRKRKKKCYDMENPNDSVPKIKIKFKTLPLPGEDAPEPHFFYVSADMVRPLDTSRPSSVETIEESTTNADDILLNSTQAEQQNSERSNVTQPTPPLPKVTNSVENAKSPTLVVKSARLSATRKLSNTKRDSTTSNTAAAGDAKNIEDMTCDVCNETGTNQNLVKCDECKKNYHFTCLDPPLKKTPKRRGYSWHCADCDPTDVEST